VAIKIHSPLRTAWFKLMSVRVDMRFSLMRMWNHVRGQTPVTLAELDAHNRKVGEVGVAFIGWLCTDPCEKYIAEKREVQMKAEKWAEKKTALAARRAERKRQQRRVSRRKMALDKVSTKS